MLAISKYLVKMHKIKKMSETTGMHGKDIDASEEHSALNDSNDYSEHHFILAKYIIYIFTAFMLIPLVLMPVVPLIKPGLGDDKCENFEVIKFFATFMGPILMAVIGYYFGSKGVEKAEKRAEEATIVKREAIALATSDEGRIKDENINEIIRKLKEDNELLRNNLKRLIE